MTGKTWPLFPVCHYPTLTARGSQKPSGFCVSLRFCISIQLFYADILSIVFPCCFLHTASTNPFAIGARSTTPVNPFLVNQPAKPSLNQLAPPLALIGSQPTVQQQQQLANSAFIGGVRPTFVPLANTAYFPAQSAPWPMAVPTSNVALPQNPNGLNPFY